MRSFFRRLPEKAVGRGPGFTLIETVVTLAVTLIILVALAQVVTDIERVWKSAAIDPFAEAQEAFASVARDLSQATLDSYPDYVDGSGSFQTATSVAFVPDHLARRSDLDFICGPTTGPGGLLAGTGRTVGTSGVFFVAPQGATQTYASAGLARLLNTEGYYVEFGNNAAPSFLPAGPPSWRWRLKRVRQSSESLQVFALGSSTAWIQQAVPAGLMVSALADNVIALVVLPERNVNDAGLPLSTDFRYDSRDGSNPLTRHQLPPRVRLTLVAIDAASAQILANQTGIQAPPLVPGELFQQAAQLDTDLAALDAGLTAQKINHRIFDREISLPSAAWTDVLSK